MAPTITLQILFPIQYANLLPASKDGAMILPASHHMNHNLPAGIPYTSWRICTS